MNPKKDSDGGVISIGTHSLYLKAAGPARTAPDQPAVIIEAGWASCSSEWVIVQRKVAEFARVYTYDRAGYGRSDPSPEPRTAENCAKELKALLYAAGVAPPYVLVGQSYGGTIIRSFLAEAAPDIVHGMVLVDAPPSVTPIPDTISEMLDRASYRHVIGLDESHVLSEEEWDAQEADNAAGEATAAAAEWELVFKGFETVLQATQGKMLLGKHRLSVIVGGREPDFQKILAWAEKNQNGSEEQRAAWRKCLYEDRWGEKEDAAHTSQLSLSQDGRVVRLRSQVATHNVHMTEPEIVVEEIRWVLGLPG